jgi:hypothetical protein
MRLLYKLLATFWVFAFSAAITVNYASRHDPFNRLESAILRVTPSQIELPHGPPSALPDTEARLEVAARLVGAKVSYVPMDNDNYGSTAMDTRVITINEKLNADVRTMTLAHELAHCLQPVTLEHGDAEMWAEGVAYLVLLPERDTLYESARYLAWHKAHLGILRVYRNEMLFAVQILRGQG